MIIRRTCLVGFLLIVVLPQFGSAQTSSLDGDLAKLKDKRPAVRLAAVKALGRRADERAIDPLVEVMKNDEDIFVSTEAATALGNFNSVRGIKALIEAYGTINASAHEEASKALKRMAPMAIPLLIETLDNADSDVSRNLMDVFEFIGETAVDPLISTLSRPEIHRMVLEALGRIKSPRAVPALMALLKHKDAYVRDGAASALGDIGDPRAIASVRPLLKDPDFDVRKSAVFALGQLKDAGSVDEIAAFAAEDDDQMKYAVGDALSSINSPRAVEHLIAAASRGDLAVVATGFRVYLRRLTPVLTRTLVETIEKHGDQQMAEAFLKSGNGRLAAAARAWAKENGYDIISFPIYGTNRRRRR